MSILIRIAVPLLILVIGWFGYSRLSVKEESAKRPPREEKLIQTRVSELRRQDFATVVRTQGTIRAEGDAVLSAHVSGRVVKIAESLQDGAFFQKDEVLLQLAEEDFEGAIISAEANLARAESTRAQELTKARQARLNWEDLGYKEEPNELVLRLPQVREAETNVLAAKAALAAAERDLSRAQVRAPFDGRVLLRSVALGQTVNPSTVLATIFSTDRVEVRLPIPARDLAYLELPETSRDAPLPVLLRDALNPESEAVWQGLIVGTEGALDPDSRELFAIARIDDPFGLAEDGESGLPPLRIGQPVTAEISARVLEDVLVIPRSAIRTLDNVNLIDPKELTLRHVEIKPVWSDESVVLVRDETIADGTLLSISRLVYAPEGGKVEILPEPTEEDDPALADGEKLGAMDGQKSKL